MNEQNEHPAFDWLSDLGPILAAQAAWHDGSYDQPLWFHLIYRPLGPFALSGGANLLADLARRFRFTPTLIQRLGALTDERRRPVFTESFLNYLQRLRIRTDVWAAPEGMLLLPDEPVAIVRGPKAHVLLLTSPMLRLLWASSHWASQAAYPRWQCGACSEEDTPPAPAVGHHPNGWAARAAYVGGAALADIPSLIQSEPPSPAADEGFLPAQVTFPVKGYPRPLVQIRRTYRGSHPQGDIWLVRLHEEVASVSKTSACVLDVRTRRHRTLKFTRFQNIYQPVLLRGYPILADAKLPYLRQRTLKQLQAFPPEKLKEYPHGWFYDRITPT